MALVARRLNTVGVARVKSATTEVSKPTAWNLCLLCTVELGGESIRRKLAGRRQKRSRQKQMHPGARNGWVIEPMEPRLIPGQWRVTRSCARYPDAMPKGRRAEVTGLSRLRGEGGPAPSLRLKTSWQQVVCLTLQANLSRYPVLERLIFPSRPASQTSVVRPKAAPVLGKIVESENLDPRP